MIVGFRLCSARYPASSGEGAKRFGGRWNRPGTARIYAAESRALCILERLVHLVRLPKDEVFTRIVIPETVSTCQIEVQDLFNGWDDPVESAVAQAAAEDTMLSHDAAVLLVPSVVVRNEHCIVIDPAHRDFARIEFGAAAPFIYDGRLIRQRE